MKTNQIDFSAMTQNELSENTVAAIGLDFIDANGTRSTSIQLVHKGTGNAIAICDFDNGFLTRAISVSPIAGHRLFNCCAQLLENSIPATFRKTLLPA